MRYAHKLFSGRYAGRPAAVLTVALGLGVACSEAPTEATVDDLAPQFDRKDSDLCGTPVNGHCHDDDPPPPGDGLATFILPILPASSPDDGLYSAFGPFTDEPLELALIVDCDQGDEFALKRPTDSPDFWPVLAEGEEIHCKGRQGFSRLDHKLEGQPFCDESVVNPAEFPCDMPQGGHDETAGNNFGPDLNYFFAVRPPGKGKRKSVLYNVVWTNATFESFGGVEGADPPDPPTCWRLLANEAEFWGPEEIDARKPVPSEDMALNVVIVRQDAPDPNSCPFLPPPPE